mmetsp:Transcript_37565/g.99987  ORF Transcript_37565/g.99987 Transcript_37565/m.99987 type:complete len:95 (-) Transcript_37565:404-688(-)
MQRDGQCTRKKSTNFAAHQSWWLNFHISEYMINPLCVFVQQAMWNEDTYSEVWMDDRWPDKRLDPEEAEGQRLFQQCLWCKFEMQQGIDQEKLF